MNYTNGHDIAIELEDMLRKEFGVDFSHSGTIFCADFIDSRKGLFYEVMNLLLFIKGQSEESLNFLNRISKTISDKSLDEIDGSEELFCEFKRLCSKNCKI